MFPGIKCDFVVGTGAALNVSIGFIPDYVKVINIEDGDKVNEGAVLEVMPYTSGGTTEIEQGDQIKGATSGATAQVLKVLLDSGSWAGGDAAGHLVIYRRSGTFASENVYVNSDDVSGINDATLTAAVSLGVDYDTEVAGVASGGIVPYDGSSTPGSEAAPGFTLSATISEDNKLLYYVALRSQN